MNDYLSPDEWERLERLRRESFVREALLQVNRIVASRRFNRVQQRAKDFLAFVVAKTLLGQADQIKEMTVALSVFGKSTNFNPAVTSTIRVAAGDLRQRLAEYAHKEGRRDVIQILLPLNTYVPDICDRRPAVSILALENWHPQGEQNHLCETIAAELAYRFDKAGIRAILGENSPIGAVQNRYALRGSVENQEEKLRMNVSLADAKSGRILCSRAVDGGRDDVLKLTREMADALLEVMRQDDQMMQPVPARKRA